MTAKINITSDSILIEDYFESNMQGFFHRKEVNFDQSKLSYSRAENGVIFFGPYTNLGSGTYQILLEFICNDSDKFEFMVYGNAGKKVIRHINIKPNEMNIIEFTLKRPEISKNSLEFVLISKSKAPILLEIEKFKLFLSEKLDDYENQSLRNEIFLRNSMNIYDEPSFDNLSKSAYSDLKNVRSLLGIKQSISRSNENEPSLEALASQLCTASQFYSPIYSNWCEKINALPRLHRKQWEFVYILEALKSYGMLSNGKVGLGFGCGKEPLPSLMAKYGCKVIATDLDFDSALNKGWTATNQHTGALEDLFDSKICDREVFFKSVQFKNVDMNNIPADLKDFDFTWSACAFEHLGSIEKGLDFVINSVKCLKPGGVAVHTTEFNLGSNDATFESESCVFFRKKDIELLISRLEKMNCEVLPLNLTISELLEDDFVDLPPYKSAPHLKLAMQGHLTTSIGLIIKKRKKLLDTILHR